MKVVLSRASICNIGGSSRTCRRVMQVLRVIEGRIAICGGRASVRASQRCCEERRCSCRRRCARIVAAAVVAGRRRGCRWRRWGNRRRGSVEGIRSRGSRGPVKHRLPGCGECGTESVKHHTWRSASASLQMTRRGMAASSKLRWPRCTALTGPEQDRTGQKLSLTGLHNCIGLVHAHVCACQAVHGLTCH